MSQAVLKFVRKVEEAGEEAQLGIHADPVPHNNIVVGFGVPACRGITSGKKLKAGLAEEVASTVSVGMPIDELINKAEALHAALVSVSKALSAADDAYVTLFGEEGSASFVYAGLLDKDDIDILLGNVKDNGKFTIRQQQM
ncbi:MAG: hypothetical protein LBC14_02815 [Desulfovibrio sp.]|nr:hypothetical protein [Desulfovibrio sp.]